MYTVQLRYRSVFQTTAWIHELTIAVGAKWIKANRVYIALASLRLFVVKYYLPCSGNVINQSKRFLSKKRNLLES